MKSTVVALSLLALVACGKKGSSNSKPGTTPPPVTGGTVTPPDEVPNTNQSNQSKPLTAPPVGTYLGACAAEGTNGFVYGVEISATAVHPVTLIYKTPTCEASSFDAWGATDEQKDFAAYAAQVKAASLLSDDEVATTFTKDTIVMESKSGTKTTLTKNAVVLNDEKRLSVYIKSSTAPTAAGLFTGELTLDKRNLASGTFDIQVYCEDANKAYVRQDSTFAIDSATGDATFSVTLKAWDSRPAPKATSCQAILTVARKDADTQDLAWSQTVDVK